VAAAKAQDAAAAKPRMNEMTEVQDQGQEGSRQDPEFQAWLARLDGSKWHVFEDEDAKQWIELVGGVLTYWIYYKNSNIVPAGTKLDNWSVALKERKFTYWDMSKEYSYEISEDGELITSHLIWSKFQQIAGHIEKFHREK
jgi:hypothetical protein